MAPEQITKYINAQEFFKENQPAFVNTDIDGDGDIDIIVSGIATYSHPDTMFGKGTKDFVDIDGDGDIDIIVSGLTKTPAGGLDDKVISGVEVKQNKDTGTVKTNRNYFDDMVLTIKIPSGSVSDETGKLVTGKVNFEIGIMPSKNDKIFTRQSSISVQDLLLTSDVMFYVNATQNGKQLNVNPERRIEITLKGSKLSNSSTIYTKGLPSGNKWDNAGRSLEINPADGSRAFQLDSFGWYNIGKRAFDAKSLTNIKVRVQDEKMKEAELWLVWEKADVVVKLNATRQGNDWSATAQNLPIGETPVLLALGTGQDGNLYMSKSRIKVAKGGSYLVKSGK